MAYKPKYTTDMSPPADRAPLRMSRLETAGARGGGDPPVRESAPGPPAAADTAAATALMRVPRSPSCCAHTVCVTLTGRSRTGSGPAVTGRRHGDPRRRVSSDPARSLEKPGGHNRGNDTTLPDWHHTARHDTAGLAPHCTTRHCWTGTTLHDTTLPDWHHTARHVTAGLVPHCTTRHCRTCTDRRTHAHTRTQACGGEDGGDEERERGSISPNTRAGARIGAAPQGIGSCQRVLRQSARRHRFEP